MTSCNSKRSLAHWVVCLWCMEHLSPCSMSSDLQTIKFFVWLVKRGFCSCQSLSFQWSIAQGDFFCLEKPHGNSRSNHYQKSGEYFAAKMASGHRFIDDLVQDTIADEYELQQAVSNNLDWCLGCNFTEYDVYFLIISKGYSVFR